MFLFINTLQTKKITLALFSNPKKIHWFEKEEKGVERENVLEVLEKSLIEQKKKATDLRGIVVVNGPGSFVGIRIALSVANALGWALSIPVCGVSFFPGQSNESLIKKSWSQIARRKKFKIVSPFYGQSPNITIVKK
jgi:tRNA A37 threonylcarbamoyladenosine modification protein TsaB